MNTEVTAPISTPIREQQRITSIDVLRGVALLGILVMNIQSFSMVGAAYMNPTVAGDVNMTGVNYVIWLVCHLFADQKFMTIFSMLFGAGIIVFTDRAEARTGKSAGLHYRRMGWLILFGLLHAHLLWYGDILYFYGISALLVYVLRRLPVGWMLAIAAVLLLVGSGLSAFTGWSMQFWPPEAIENTRISWTPDPDTMRTEIDAYRGSWLEQAPVRSVSAIFFETFLFFIYVWWRIVAMMLIGMALFKGGFFSATRSRATYVVLVAGGVFAGLPLVGLGIYFNFLHEWSLEESMFLGSQFNYWGSILVALGWIGLVMLICQAKPLTLLTRPFAAVGRMAFTNYIMQTVICTTIFYGHGFGQFGHFERWQQFGVVLAVWAFQLVASPIWLHYFRFGPLEWLWRSLSYWQRQPMRRRAEAASLST